MTSYLRQFMYLVVDGKRPRILDLHCIDMSRFFTQRSPLIGEAVDARLPCSKMTFCAPSSEHCSGTMHFTLLGRDKVLATDQTGRASIYDAGLHALCTTPALSKPKHRPLHVAIGDRLYVLDSTQNDVVSESEPSFEVIAYESVRAPDGFQYNDWHCHSLPMPPCRPTNISSYAVVGNSDIWVSADDEGTYSFDTSGGAWVKKGDWTLPFRGLAHYVSEYKLWFGLSSKNNIFSAFDLTRQQSPPVLLNVLEDIGPQKKWLPITSFLVHLGSTRFCIARLFCIDDDDRKKKLAVFTVVEVEPLCETSKGLRMVKCKSLCYKLRDNILNHFVF
ncbi:uncharacterized protein LOC120647214 [Panicum virgatum]|uniref:Uncharacterized protein n=1 Tax=Panicum virgatum TaxID=38727 RepID=A0A8T0P7A3_PANVG|nr:uncharacterized protein LOC120647214 [Panicum virgatum]XP_039779830.1 uncharacterized protein LOC120647214 [Panicum virgatum]XP_039779831.1 uncharacterized protein LOC120647214 [Panicum virgatum]XP_039779832.1 uncharacterized protein LOC120647214 [Panicum virgatum]XP_039779833.1 uncharacterized protein LOC120647214 [Panicum virgatum]XP_039779834.1 uncharacterized protein LOC120647214 [Panicum virgatum]XP_039779835.1 uncharacterized protein LOC120647214 [Panicum virgatum]XP_039779836.1 unc